MAVQAADQFVIEARPPVRAFAVAAVLALAGAGVAVVPASGMWQALLIICGLVLIVGGTVLVVAALSATRRQRVLVELGEQGYRVDAPDGVRTGKWADVKRVTAAPGRITLHQGDDERVHLVAPGGQTPQLEAIAAGISKRLDDDRGYQVWEG